MERYKKEKAVGRDGRKVDVNSFLHLLTVTRLPSFLKNLTGAQQVVLECLVMKSSVEPCFVVETNNIYITG